MSSCFGGGVSSILGSILGSIMGGNKQKTTQMPQNNMYNEDMSRRPPEQKPRMRTPDIDLDELTMKKMS